MRPKIFAFFSGAGFLDLGFETAGFEVVFANELRAAFLKGHQYARKQLGLNEPVFGYSQSSIVDYLESPILRHDLTEMVNTAKESGELVGFIGGPPCPDFSVGGKNRGRHGENGKLSLTYIELICKQKPDFFLFENVKGLWRTKRHREFFEELKNRLREEGYVTTEKLINAINYGAPQDRERIILVGIRGGREVSAAELIRKFDWYRYAKFQDDELKSIVWPSSEPFIEGTRKKPVTVPEALTVQYWFDRNMVEQHPNSGHCFTPRAGLVRFQTVEEGDDSRKSYKRLHRWRYSPTVCYGNNEVHLHPYKPRRISVAEALALQSLPPEFSLPSNMTLSDMFKTVGNGVPFLAAKGLASSFIDILKEFHETNRFESSARDKSTTQASGLRLRQSTDEGEGSYSRYHRA